MESVNVNTTGNRHAGLFLVCLLVWPTGGRAAEREPRSPCDLAALSRPPKVYPGPGLQAEGVRGLFYEGLPWQGKPTRVFAWYGAPERKPGEEKLPAMVLAHGGGGTAFDEWVRIWNRHGYAAIAMDLEGTLPTGKYPDRPRNDWAGPMRSGDFSDLDGPVQDQWFCHAVADIILAHSLLASFPEIDAERIGLTGISWGGILTCTTAGVDHRFKLAIPVYGCGYVNEIPHFHPKWPKFGRQREKKWIALWDPARYLPHAHMPMLWVNGSNDPHFPLSIHSRSYRLAPGPKTLCIHVGMFHAHPPAWEPEEIYAFADSILEQGQPLAKVEAHGTQSETCFVTFEAKVPVQRAELVYTESIENWVECEWRSRKATINAAGTRAEASLPDRCAAWFFNLIDERGLQVSSVVETTADGPPTSQSSPR